ncbi:MAG: hypothetical protein M0T70_10520 [Geobacteraceae bacterium]|nr:hypothetical protein [Geobacteraceae bacterium]
MKLITKDQALDAITNGEFGEDIIRSAEKVAVILTQSWCPQWHSMKIFVANYPAAEVYVLEYDRTDYFDEFRQFKERQFANDQIPYVRYYSKGVFVAESNSVSEELFHLNLF